MSKLLKRRYDVKLYNTIKLIRDNIIGFVCRRLRGADEKQPTLCIQDGQEIRLVAVTVLVMLCTEKVKLQN